VIAFDCKISSSVAVTVVVVVVVVVVVLVVVVVVAMILRPSSPFPPLPVPLLFPPPSRQIEVKFVTSENYEQAVSFVHVSDCAVS